MKKKDVRAYVILGVVFFVFTVVSFVVPFVKNVSFIISYFFGVVAIALQLYVYKITFEKGDDAKSRFYGFPIARIGVTYLIVQLAVSLASMVLATFVNVFLAWIFIVVDVIILAVAVIGCIAADTMRDEIEKQDKKLKADVSGMRELQSLASSIAGQCDNDNLKSVLQKLQDEFKYSDPVSCDATKAMESDMQINMREIQQAVIDGDEGAVKTLCAKLMALLAERNRVCRLNK